MATAELGISGVAAFPLRNGTTTLGALTLYRTARRRLFGQALVDSALLADLTTTVVVADLDELTTAPRSAPGRVPADRVTIAVGITCVQLGITPEEALARIRARAFAAGRSVSALANDIMDNSLRLD